ncbi:MAG: hypothetical protein JXR83_06255 [Deltaproteobacteria bacterium]|nr:hypothetical protein [Deltaproteobacteria bacterium]
MSEQDHKLPPLNDDLAALLDAARREPDPPAVAKQRVHAMIMATVLPPLVGPGQDGGGAGPIAGGAGGAATGGAVATGGATMAPAVKLALVAAASAAVGVGAGVLYVARPAPVAPVEAPAVVAPAPPPQPPPVVVAPTPVPPPVELPPPKPLIAPRPIADTLAAEQALLERARSALKTEDAATALTLLREHGERYPRGRLVEEREALRVLALFQAESADAAAAAAKFRARFQHSIFLPAIENAAKQAPVN